VTSIPDPVARVAALMSTFRQWWCLCGGWAVDAWLGRQTRDHVDVDVAVFDEDQRAIFEQLGGWRLIAHDERVDQETTEPWDGRRLVLPAHVHARSEDGSEFEVLVNERSGDDWILRGEPRITMPLARCVRSSSWDVPTAVPEVLLFYKGTAYFGDEEMRAKRGHDDVDFAALVDRLDRGTRAWLRDAIALLYPDHPWLLRLSA
jgi:hypothetical protein